MADPNDSGADEDAPVDVSIILNVMGLRELAVYGFRSWLLQDYERPYEVVLNLFYPCRDLFEPLTAGKNPNCRVKVTEHEQPEFFNISAANNLGLHLSSGEYVIFANADMIYASHFLRTAIKELKERDISYAVASRVNMTPAHNRLLKPVEQYTRESGGFDHLNLLERERGINICFAISPWMVKRELMVAIGGFDPRILMAEDIDLLDRATHYLKRTGKQNTQISLANLFGYHQHHAGSGLFDAWTQSAAVFEARHKRLVADPTSTEDVIPTRLDDYDALIRDIRATRPPPKLVAQPGEWKGKLLRRATKVWKALAHGA